MHNLEYFCKEKLSILPVYLFNPLFPVVCIHMYLFHTLNYNSMQHYLLDLASRSFFQF